VKVVDYESTPTKGEHSTENLHSVFSGEMVERKGVYHHIKTIATERQRQNIALNQGNFRKWIGNYSGAL
jgi:hypothetical protein